VGVTLAALLGLPGATVDVTTQPSLEVFDDDGEVEVGSGGMNTPDITVEVVAVPFLEDLFAGAIALQRDRSVA
jgi:hypothetical protein